jgi:hypothetical protein
MARFINSHRGLGSLLVCGLVGLVLVALAWRGDPRSTARAEEETHDPESSKIKQGFEISPVPLDLRRKNRALVGLGSYIVNSGGCNDCHTQPQYAPGGDPFLGQPEQINTAGYLAGGRAFGPFISPNLTPDPVTGLPAGLTFAEFLVIIRTGIDADHVPPHVPSADNDLLQVMPWPVLRNRTDRDLRAVYEYLRAIPSIP